MGDVELGEFLNRSSDENASCLHRSVDIDENETFLRILRRRVGRASIEACYIRF